MSTEYSPSFFLRITDGASSSSQSSDVRLELLDDGRGAPDVTRNDGIYSAHASASALAAAAPNGGDAVFSVAVTAINGGGARVPKREEGRGGATGRARIRFSLVD